MVGSTFFSPRSLLNSAASADAGSARISNGAAGARRNGWTSRAVRLGSRAHARAHARAHDGHPGLMPGHPIIAGDHNHNHDWNSTDSSHGSGRPGSGSDSDPVAAPAVRPARTSSSVPVLPITCAAVGGIIALAVVLAIVYVWRIRRRVRSMKRCTNVLGPELAPMSPSQLSQSSTVDSPRVKPEGMHIQVPPRMMSELPNHLPPLSAVSVSSPTSTQLPDITPLSPIRTSTFILNPPPAAAKRSTVRFSNPNPHSIPRSPIYPSRPAVPLITAPSLSNHPQYDYEARSTSPCTSDIASRSPIRKSTFILSPPPAAAKRSTFRLCNPNPHSNPRSSVYSSRPAVPCPPTLSDHPQHDYDARNPSPGTPRSPIRTSTFILSNPPPAEKRLTIRPSNRNPHSTPRSPIYPSRPAVPWPLITALSLGDHPRHDYEDRNTSSHRPGFHG